MHDGILPEVRKHGGACWKTKTWKNILAEDLELELLGM